MENGIRIYLAMKIVPYSFVRMILMDVAVFNINVNERWIYKKNVQRLILQQKWIKHKSFSPFTTIDNVIWNEQMKLLGPEISLRSFE